MNIQLTLALRYLLGRKLRTALTTLAIVFGVLLIFGMNTILPAFVTSLQANALAAAGQVDVTITNRTNDAFSAGEVARVARWCWRSTTCSGPIKTAARSWPRCCARPTRRRCC